MLLYGWHSSTDREQSPRRKPQHAIETPPMSASTSVLCSANGSQTSPTVHSDDSTRLSPQSSNQPRDAHEGNKLVRRTLNPENRTTHQSSRQTSRQTSVEQRKQEVRPFYAGESEGLEFLFDICCPDRPFKGQHYAVPAHSYRAKRSYRKQPVASRQMPSLDIQQELLRCFFRYVWPLLPILDLQDFLTAYIKDATAISPLLLWSIYFAAANVRLRPISNLQVLTPAVR